ncbi:MAG: PEP-CTERM sorting domain-containing protein [Planctomycetota bacterium]|nr:PEP-CTERM sorting domain-containing protein [Planctomycetota bacterium]
MNKIIIGALCALAGAANADIITQWNFNSVPADGNVATGTLTPSIGSGTASGVGGVNATAFASGDANGGSTDPLVTSSTTSDSGWQVTTFAAQNTGNLERGVQFLVSTVGFQDIIVTFDQRHSNTSSRFYAGQYTVDGGTNWITAVTFEGNAGDTWFNGRTIDLSSVTATDNNANFGIRVVAAFATGTNAYVASSGTATYAAAGTARFDMMTVAGSAVPAPGSVALVAVGGLMVARRRRN